MSTEQSLLVNYFDEFKLSSFTDIDGDVWFQCNHVCNILGYQNPSDVIARNVEECDRRKIDIGGLQAVWFVNECGLYDLIIGCRKPMARPFHRWMSHTVLPSIRKKGVYVDESRFSEDEREKLEAVVAERNSRIDQLEKESLSVKLALDDSLRESHITKKQLQVEVENNHVFATEADLHLGVRSAQDKKLQELKESLRVEKQKNQIRIPELPPGEYEEKYNRDVVAVYNKICRLVDSYPNSKLKKAIEALYI